MGMGLGEMTVRIGVDPSAFESGINAVMDRLDELPAATARASEQGAGGLAGFASGIMDLGTKIGMTAFAIQQMGNMAGGLVKALTGPNAQMEQWQIAMETLTHSTGAAKQMLQDLTDFSAHTPFQLDGLVSASESLLSFGFSSKSVIPTLTSIGDAISAFGGSQSQVDSVVQVFGRLQATGKLTTREIMELATEHIPALNIIAQQMGITTAQASEKISKGLVSGNDAVQMLTKGFEQMYGGAMQKQSQTFNGLVSTLHDNIEIAFRSFTGPLFDQAKTNLVALGNAVSSKAFQDFAANAGVTVGNTLNMIGGVIGGTVVPAFRLLGDWVSANKAGLQNLGTVFGALGLDALNLFRSVQNVATALFSNFAPKLGSLKTDFQPVLAILDLVDLGIVKLQVAVDTFGPTVLTAALGVSRLVTPMGQAETAISALYKEGHQLSFWFTVEMKPALEGALPGFEKLGMQIAQLVIGAAPLIAKLGELEAKIMLVATPIIEFLLPIIVKLAGWLAGQLAQALAVVGPAFLQAANAVIDFANKVLDRLQPILSWLLPLLQKGVELVASYWTAVWPSMQHVFSGVWDVISGVIKIAWSLVSGIILIGLDLLSGNWGQAWTDMKNMFRGVWDGIQQILGGALKIVTGLLSGAWAGITWELQHAWNLISSWLGGWWNDSVGQFRAELSILGTVLSAGWKAFTTLISNGAGALKDTMLAPFVAVRDSIGGVMRAMGNAGITVLNAALRGWVGFADDFGQAIDSVTDKLGIGRPIPNISAPQIPMLAKGTGYHTGGPAIVGEQGPELVYLPRGATVVPNSLTKALLGRVPGYANGIGDILGAIGGTAGNILGGIGNQIGSWIASGAGAVIGHLKDILSGAVPRMPGVLGSMVGSGANLFLNQLGTFIQNAFNQAAGSGGDTSSGSAPPGTLPGIPLINQLALNQASRFEDCVPSSLAAGVSYLLGHYINPLTLKNAVYGAGYNAGESASSYIGYLARLGIHEWQAVGSNPDLIVQIKRAIMSGYPVAASIPSAWNSNTGSGWHEVLFSGWDRATDTLTAMNPWKGFWQSASSAWWTPRLRGSEVFPLTKMANGGILNEPVLGLGLNSGRHYALGEAGPEAVVPLSGSTGSGQVVIEIDGRALAKVLWPHLAAEFRQKAGVRTV